MTGKQTAKPADATPKTKYRKRPIVVTAEQFNEAIAPWPTGVVRCADMSRTLTGGCFIGMTPHVHTLEGPLRVSEGDWIITGVSGEIYPCKPDVFAETYKSAAPPVTGDGDEACLEIATEVATEDWDTWGCPDSLEWVIGCALAAAQKAYAAGLARGRALGAREAFEEAAKAAERWGNDDAADSIREIARRAGRSG